MGIIVLAGTMALVVALYFIGRVQHMFGSSIRVSAEFYNVSGLRKGNSVRFTGIDIGTVESVEIISDTCVRVVMIIDEDVHGFIKKNAIVSIGTDGMMGNKLVNINPVPGSAASVQEGDVLVSLRPVEMDATVRTLNSTSENINAISADLREIIQKLNVKTGVLSLLEDEVLAGNVRGAVAQFRLTGRNTAILTGDLKHIVSGIRSGGGTAGLLLSDTLFAQEIRQIVVDVHALSDSVAVVTGNFRDLSQGLKDGNGTIGMLLTDTSFVRKLNHSMEDLQNGAGSFNRSMDAMQHKWPFRKKKSSL